MWDIFNSIGAIDNIRQKGSIKYYKKKLQEYQENEADVLIDMGLLYFEDEEYEESLKHLKKANDIYSSLGRIESSAFVHDLMGDVYLSSRDIDNALDNYRIAFEFYSSVKSYLKDEILDKIKETNDIKEAIELVHENRIKEGIENNDFESDDQDVTPENVDELADEVKIANCHLSYTDISPQLELVMKIIKNKYVVKDTSKEEYESGFLQKSIYDAHREEDNKTEIGLLLVLSNYLMKENKLYGALQNLKNAFKVSHELGDQKGEAFSLLLLGIVYYLLGKENKIYEIFKKSINIFKEIDYEKGEILALEIINIMYDKDECSYIENTA
ncbi:MAG: hypothetical protein ACPK7O_07660 [Methanobacterium sp.]